RGIKTNRSIDGGWPRPDRRGARRPSSRRSAPTSAEIWRLGRAIIKADLLGAQDFDHAPVVQVNLELTVAKAVQGSEDRVDRCVRRSNGARARDHWPRRHADLRWR